MPKGKPKVTAVDDKLAALKSAEKAARELYYHWIGRAHPNSIKMSQVKAAHHKAMLELVAYQEENEIRGEKIKPLPPATMVDDLETPESGVVAYEVGHKVKSVRAHKEENQRFENKLGAELLDAKTTS